MNPQHIIKLAFLNKWRMEEGEDVSITWTTLRLRLSKGNDIENRLRFIGRIYGWIANY